MEIHRLKPMKPGYDSELFNELYEKTARLRNKLVFEIDNRRLGASKEEVLSWFDDKFLLAFNKYWDKEPDRLLGYIINSLKTFKFRVLRKAYQENIFQNSIRLDEVESYINVIPEEEPTGKEALLGLALSFMKMNLSDDALFLLELELNPPPFLINRIKTKGQPILAKDILEYLDIPTRPETIEWIKALREEIWECTQSAKEYFKANKTAVNF